MPVIPVHNREREVVAKALVDASDLDRLAPFNWTLNSNGYVKRSERVDGRNTMVPLHRDLLGLQPGDGLFGDHINGNRLDNRRANLRVLRPADSAQNRIMSNPGRSRHRGVAWHGQCGRWQVVVAGKYIGLFDVEDEAAAAAATARADLMPYAVER